MWTDGWWCGRRWSPSSSTPMMIESGAAAATQWENGSAVDSHKGFDIVDRWSVSLSNHGHEENQPEKPFDFDGMNGNQWLLPMNEDDFLMLLLLLLQWTFVCEMKVIKRNAGARLLFRLLVVSIGYLVGRPENCDVANGFLLIPMCGSEWTMCLMGTMYIV